MSEDILRTVAITNEFIDEILDDVLESTDPKHIRAQVRSDLIEYIENEVEDTLYDALKGYCEDVIVPEKKKGLEL